MLPTFAARLGCVCAPNPANPHQLAPPCVPLICPAVGVQQVFVDKLHWVTSTVFIELLALTQFMPGPTSTQLSFALGVTQRGVTGGLLSGKRRMCSILVSQQMHLVITPMWEHLPVTDIAMPFLCVAVWGSWPCGHAILQMVSIPYGCSRSLHLVFLWLCQPSGMTGGSHIAACSLQSVL